MLSDESDPFVTCLGEIVFSDKPKSVKLAWNELEEMETQKDGGKDYIYGCNRNYDEILRKLLTEMPIKNIAEMPKLLEWFSKFPFGSKPLTDDIACFLTTNKQLFKVIHCFLHDYSVECFQCCKVCIVH